MWAVKGPLITCFNELGFSKALLEVISGCQSPPLGFGLRASALYLKPSETRKSTSATEAVALDSNGKLDLRSIVYTDIPIYTICPCQ